MLVVPLLDIGDAGVDIDADVSVSSLQPEGVEALPVATVAVQGHLSDLGGDYLFMGHLQGTFDSTCDRCLQAAHVPFDVEVAWNFETDPAKSFQDAGLEIDDDIDLEDSAVCRPVHGEAIDLGPHVWEELALAVPWKFLCDDDCLGLCPVCGKNRNADPCSCEADAAREEASPPEGGARGFAGLAKLLPELRAEEKAEEQ